MPFSYALAVLWSLSVTGVLIFGVLVVTLLYPPFAKSLILVGLWEIAVYLGACRAFVRIVGGVGDRARDVLGLRSVAPGVLGVAVALGAVMQIPANSAAALVERFYPTPQRVLDERILQLTPRSPLEAVGLFLVAAVAVPFVEELFFRGALFGALRRKGYVFGACVASALCFVIAHLDPHLWIPLLLVATALSHVRYVTGSLWPGVALHACFNGVTLLAVFSGNAPRTPTQDLGLGVVVGGWIVAAGLLWLVQRLATTSAVALRARDEAAP